MEFCVFIVNMNYEIHSVVKAPDSDNGTQAQVIKFLAD